MHTVGCTRPSHVKAADPSITFIVDSMSGFGAYDVDMVADNVHYMVSSANKNIEGVPGCGCVQLRARARARVSVSVCVSVHICLLLTLFSCSLPASLFACSLAFSIFITTPSPFFMLTCGTRFLLVYTSSLYPPVAYFTNNNCRRHRRRHRHWRRQRC